MPRLFLPELMFAGGKAIPNGGLLVDDDGRVAGVFSDGNAWERAAPIALDRIDWVRMPGKVLLPGLANAHSHTFQRLFRGRAESRAVGGDTFWTWREQMYKAACFLSPEDLHAVARAAFLEMLAAGITVVGEFHYLHRDRDGMAYAEPNLLSEQVIRAAQSVGIRMVLLRTAYQRAGYQKQPHRGQRRFYEPPEEYLANLEALRSATAGMRLVTVGAAPHSIRAVPIEQFQRIAEWAREREMPLHFHISEQPSENEACLAEYGRTPLTLMAQHGILSPRSALVHAIHGSDAEYGLVAESGATICSCPTTERNLGDGIFPAARVAQLGIPVAFGTDSQAQIDILEDARQLEYHLRLERRERGVLDSPEQGIDERLFAAATGNGYRALGLSGGSLAVGEPADFFTASLDDWAILGVDADSLTAQTVFALGRSAVRDVAVEGRLVLTDGQHPLGEEVRAQYRAAQQRFVIEEG